MNSYMMRGLGIGKGCIKVFNSRGRERYNRNIKKSVNICILKIGLKMLINLTETQTH